MDLTFSFFLQNGVKSIPAKVLSKQIENALLKEISNELDTLKTFTSNLPKHNDSFRQNLQILKNFKPSFQNLSLLEKALEDISKNLPQNLPKKSEIEKRVKILKALIKESVLFKDIQKNALLLKNEIQTLSKEIKDNPDIKNLTKKTDNFLKLINKDANTNKKELYSAFKEIAEHFEKIKKIADFKNIPLQRISSIQKHIDTISTLLELQHTQKKEIKNFETFLKEMIVTHKKGKVTLSGKQTLIKNIENITKNIKTIYLSLPNTKKYIPIKAELKNFTQNIQETNLEKNIKNSGVFYETKLLKSDLNDTSIKEFATKDVKAILLKLKNDESIKDNHQLNTAIDKTINQINTVQTNALLTQSLFTYIPFGWDNLKDGSLMISNLKKKDNFSCKIELELENCGRVNVLMLFTQELLSLNLDIKNEKFKNLLLHHKSELKKALQGLGYDTAIFFGKQKSNRYDLQSELEADMGMDIKI